MSIVQKLTEGIVNRNMEQEGQALLNKWSQTGLQILVLKEVQKTTFIFLCTYTLTAFFIPFTYI